MHTISHISTLALTDHLAIALNLTEKDKYFRKPSNLCNERSPRVLEIPGIATVTAFLNIEASNRPYQCMKLEFGFLVRSFAQSVVDTIYEESYQWEHPEDIEIFMDDDPGATCYTIAILPDLEDGVWSSKFDFHDSMSDDISDDSDDISDDSDDVSDDSDDVSEVCDSDLLKLDNIA